MNDLQGVLELIAAYPVHILTMLGCILLAVLVIPRRRRQRKHLSISPESTAKKTELTQDEKNKLVKKINENRRGNIKKSFAGTMSSYGMIFITIGLIIIVVLWIAYVVTNNFHK